MTTKRIFTYGCSFGRWRWPCWPDMVQKNFGDEYKYIKNSNAGLGNQGIFYMMLEDDLHFKFTEDDIILVGWSGWTREDRLLEKGKWDCCGNLLTSSNPDKYGEEYVKKYWSMSNYIMRNTSAIIAANKMFNITHQHHIFDYDNLEDNGAQSRTYKFMNKLNWKTEPAESRYNFKQHWANLPEKELFNDNKGYKQNSYFGRRIADSHPDIIAQLEHTTAVLEKIGLTMKQETIDFYTQEYQRVIDYIDNSDPIKRELLQDGNWDCFSETFKILFTDIDEHSTGPYTQKIIIKNFKKQFHKYT